MKYELLFLLKDRAAMLWIAIAFLSALAAVLLGLNDVNQQRSALVDLKKLDQIERTIALDAQSDWGSAAYYTFHLTYDPPSDFAFAAFGERDVSPWKHRIRMLALEGQIYETDAENPDFALIGRFDYAFVVALLAPLFVILLLYDLRSGERAAGRFDLIETSAGNGARVWISRTVLRLLGLYTALLIPLWLGGIVEVTSISTLLAASLALFLYLLFWGAMTYCIAGPSRNGSANLTYLTGVWLFICAIMPAVIVITVNNSVTLPDGGDIVLTQREAVNDAWDLPKEATYAPFLERHPDWENDTGWASDSFEWKWYYAFQQVGDQKAEDLSQAYRQGRVERDKRVSQFSVISPASFMQRHFESLAKTDASASLAYETRVRAFHKALRHWHYPKLFKNEVFDAEDAKRALPVYQPNLGGGDYSRDLRN